MEEENDQRKHDYFTWKGALREMAENLQDAMEQQYYSQLEHSIVAYKNVTVLQIMKHLDTEWVPMKTKEKQAIKKKYYKPWDLAGGVALSAFTKALDEQKTKLHVYNVTTEEEDVKEHYMVQMYASNVFSKADLKECASNVFSKADLKECASNVFSETDMKEWEKKSEADKDDWVIMKKYFREKMSLCWKSGLRG
jgi:hypothetical protein